MWNERISDKRYTKAQKPCQNTLISTLLTVESSNKIMRNHFTMESNRTFCAVAWAPMMLYSLFRWHNNNILYKIQNSSQKRISENNKNDTKTENKALIHWSISDKFAVKFTLFECNGIPKSSSIYNRSVKHSLHFSFEWHKIRIVDVTMYTKYKFWCWVSNTDAFWQSTPKNPPKINKTGIQFKKSYFWN